MRALGYIYGDLGENPNDKWWNKWQDGVNPNEGRILNVWEWNFQAKLNCCMCPLLAAYCPTDWCIFPSMIYAGCMRVTTCNRSGVVREKTSTKYGHNPYISATQICFCVTAVGGSVYFLLDWACLGVKLGRYSDVCSLLTCGVRWVKAGS